MDVRPVARDTEDPARNTGQILRQALSTEDWTRLVSRGRPLSFTKGETIIARGSPGDCMYLIEQGRVEISLMLADGNKAVLNQMGPGELLGELALLDGGPRSADAIAASGEVQLIAIGRSHVFAILENSSGVLAALISELCARVRNASRMFEVKSEKSAQVRLARTLLQLAAKWGERRGGVVELPGFSQSELGDYAGLARENVNRQLKIWEDETLIRRNGDGLSLLDMDAIADIAQL